VENSDYRAFANKILDVLDNYDKAIKVGQKGKNWLLIILIPRNKLR